MAAAHIDKEQIIAAIRETADRLLELLNAFSPDAVNIQPFEGSWTAAQVADHITRSNLSIAKAMRLKGTEINRDPAERTEELKDLFLDFNKKFKSPDFILPMQDIYRKESVIDRLEQSVKKISEVSESADLSEMINHPAFGNITKLEILYFVLFHTQRHTHQLERIYLQVK